ncbi:MAG: CHAT domain-containing protein [Planctomycetota bacterium]
MSQVYSLRDELPSIDASVESRVGGALLEITSVLEPLVFDQRDPDASLSYAYASVAISGLGEFARNGISALDWRRNCRFASEVIHPEARAQIELEIANALRMQGRIDEARAILLDVYADFGSVALPWVTTLLADMDRIRGQASEALARLDEAEASLSIEQPFHDQVRAVIFGLRGQIYLELGVIDQAARWFEEERRSAEELNNPELQVAVLMHSAVLLLANPQGEGTPELLAKLLEEHLAKGGNPELQATLSSMLGRVSAYRAIATGGDPNEAIEQLKEATSRDALPREESIDAGLYLVRLLIENGQLEEAQTEFTRIEELVLSAARLIGTNGRTRDRGLLAALRCELELAHKSSPFPVRHLLELEVAYDAMLRQWEQTPLRPGGVGFLNSQERLTVLEVLVRTHIAAEPNQIGIANALESVIRAQARGTLARELDAPEVRVERVREELLYDNSGMLVYLPTPQRTHLFVLDKSSIAHFECPGVHRFEAERRQFQALLNTPLASDKARGDQLGSDWAALTDSLIPGDLKEQVLAWSQLTLVGTGYLGFFPFEALPIAGTYLGLKIPIGYLPSLPIGCALNQRRDNSTQVWERDLLLVTAPALNQGVKQRWPDLAELKLGLEQVETLHSSFEPHRSRVLHFDAATRAALTFELQKPTAMLHILAHGVRDSTRERSTGLALGGSPEELGVLWPEDVESEQMPPLVLLSACGSARGPVRYGDDGASHLGGAFIRAGTDTVVFSRADLELESTLLLSKHFTWRLSLGARPAEALYHARLVVAEQFDNDPFYFALTHAVGLTHRPMSSRVLSSPISEPDSTIQKNRSLSPVWIAVGLGLFAVASAYILHRIRGQSSLTGS